MRISGSHGTKGHSTGRRRGARTAHSYSRPHQPRTFEAEFTVEYSRAAPACEETPGRAEWDRHSLPAIAQFLHASQPDTRGGRIDLLV